MANIMFPEWLIVLIFVAVMINDFVGILKQYINVQSGKKAVLHCCGCSAPTTKSIQAPIYRVQPMVRKGSMEPIDLEYKTVINRRKSTYNPKLHVKDEIPSNKVDTTNCKIHNDED